MAGNGGARGCEDLTTTISPLCPTSHINPRRDVKQEVPIIRGAPSFLISAVRGSALSEVTSLHLPNCETVTKTGQAFELESCETQSKTPVS